MNKRNAVRYDFELLPESLNKVVISWGGSEPVESLVINCCSHGMKVTIVSNTTETAIPNKNEILKICIPKIQQSLKGMCVYAKKEPDNTVTLGIYLINPSEQNFFEDFLHGSLKHKQQQCYFIKHEWEELVTKLCNSEDPKLSQIGCHEMDNIRKLKSKNY